MRCVLMIAVMAASWQTAAAQIDATLPEIEGLPGDTVEIPVQVTDLTAQDVRGFTFKLLYESSVLEVIAASLSGTIAEGSALAINARIAGEFVVASANARALSGSGTIVRLTALLKDEGISPLQFDYFQFNDGEPATRTFEGSVRSGTSTGAATDERPREGFRIVGHYPEPADDVVTLLTEAPVTTRAHIRVFNVEGREVVSRSVWLERGDRGAILLEIGNLPQGTYLYRISVDDAAQGGLMTVVR